MHIYIHLYNSFCILKLSAVTAVQYIIAPSWSNIDVSIHSQDLLCPKVQVKFHTLIGRIHYFKCFVNIHKRPLFGS